MPIETHQPLVEFMIHLSLATLEVLMKLTLSLDKDLPYMVEMMQLLISKCQGDFYLGLFEAG